MQISNVLAGFSDPLALGKSKESGEVAATRSTEPSRDSPGAQATRPGAKLTEILARYDVQRISPAQFSEMIQKLHDAGAISQQEYRQLSGIRSDLDQAGVAVDEPVDLLQFYTRMIEKAQRQIDTSSGTEAAEHLQSVLRRLDWVQKFALIQSNPTAVGLDAMV